MIERYEKSHSHRGGPIPGPKRQLYKWETIKNAPGELCWIDKKELCIDTESYQRKQTSISKVTDIASKFDWTLFEAITVALRNDGKYYVIEGGHRTRAAWARDDIDNVPCVVFKDKSIKEEAQAFVDSATSVSAISSYDKFKAQLCAGNKTAELADDMLKFYGLYATNSSSDPNGIKSIRAVISMIETSDVADAVIELCRDICNYEVQISGHLIRGLKYLLHNQQSLGFNVGQGKLRERLISIGPKLLIKSMRTEAGLSGLGGEKVYARGIVNALNKGLRNKLHINI